MLTGNSLSVAQQTVAIRKERDFIEATSRISSFNVTSRPGVALLPIEVRLTKDRLALVSQILASNDSAYKHIEVLLELVHKLGPNLPAGLQRVGQLHWIVLVAIASQ